MWNNTSSLKTFKEFTKTFKGKLYLGGVKVSSHYYTTTQTDREMRRTSKGGGDARGAFEGQCQKATELQISPLHAIQIQLNY